MKWFKHFSDSLDDPFIQELMDKFGHQGYVAWFGIIEIIAKENGSKLTGKLEISPTYLKRKLRISSTKLQLLFNFCSTKGKLFFNFQKDLWVFEIPKILDLKDNYTKDLQETCKPPHTHKEVEEEKEVEKEKHTVDSSKNSDFKYKKFFEEIWAKYPNKDGKKYAEKYFKASVKTQEDFVKINIALDKYLLHLKTQTWKRPKNGSTWFNNWSDWENWVEPEGPNLENKTEKFQRKPIPKEPPRKPLTEADNKAGVEALEKWNKGGLKSFGE